MSNKFSVLSSPYAFVATLFGVGYLPFAPGTWGSLAALSTFLFFVIYFALNFITVFFITVFIIIFSILVCHQATSKLIESERDQKSIVLDEFAGLWVACLPSAGILMVKELLIFSVLAFIFFRVFDIWKPAPIGLIDNKFKNGLGIVGDDLIAGIYAAITTSLVFYLFV